MPNNNYDWISRTHGWAVDEFYQDLAAKAKRPVEDANQEESPTYQTLDHIAEAALQELEANGIIEVLILKNDQVATWWSARKKLREAERREAERIANERRIREAALAKLTPEERKLLGLPAPVKRVRRVKPNI